MTPIVRFVAEFTLLTALALALVLAGGCIEGMGYSTRDRVTEAAREYNDGVRWGRYEQAVHHLPKDVRDRFLERHKALEEELEISDCAVVSLDVDSSNRKHATVRVEYEWSLKRRGLLEKTSTTQAWEERDGTWVVASETRTKGAPLTLFEEPTKAP